MILEGNSILQFTLKGVPALAVMHIKWLGEGVFSGGVAVCFDSPPNWAPSRPRIGPIKAP